MEHLVYVPIVLFTMLVIWRASDGFELASEFLGEYYNLRDGVRGATINAIASSLPEVFTTFFFLYTLHNVGEGIAGGIGTTAGSAVYNSLVIPSLVVFAVIGLQMKSPVQVKVSRKVLLRDGIALLICEGVLILILNGNRLYWYHGLILMGLYIVYLYGIFRSMGREGSSMESSEREPAESGQAEKEEGDNGPAESRKEVGRDWRGFLRGLFTLDLEQLILGKREIDRQTAIALLLLSTTIMGVACWYLVRACEEMAFYLGLKVYFIAVIIAAAATSVPDTIISIRDGLKGNYDDAISNALGSNIFDICFALGFPLFMYSILNRQILNDGISFGEDMLMGADLTILRVLLLILTFLALLIFVMGKRLDRWKATTLLLLYLSFVGFVILRAYGHPWAQGLVDWFAGLAVL